MKRIIIFVLAIAWISLTGITATKAEMITFYPTVVLGDGAVPAGPSPWIAAVFDDHDQQGSVTLTLTNVNITDGEFVSRWFFNFAPTLNP